MKIALIRHPAPLIEAGIYYGRLDVGLSPDGIASVPGIVRQLADFPAHKIWSSPARRCQVLACAIADATKAAALQDERLQELDFGAWEGQAWDNVPRELLDKWALDLLGFAPPSGETGSALIARVRSFHTALINEGQSCVVVSHGGPLKLLANLLRGGEVDLLAKAPAFGWIDMVSC